MAMTQIPTRNDRRDVNHVIALFSDSLLAFELPRDATFVELAERVAAFGRVVHSTPISVAVRRAP
jgi:hypothetical protein